MKNNHDQEIIIGIHSIVQAIKNPKRSDLHLFLTHDSKIEISKLLDIRGLKNIQVTVLSKHDLQEKAKSYYQQLGFEFHKILSQMFLLAAPLPEALLDDLYKTVEGECRKILALDQVTDIHNGAAILRTACFFGVHDVILPMKGSFSLSPSFYRIASGAREHLNLYFVAHMSRLIEQLKKRSVVTIGLSEHATETKLEELKDSGKSILLAMGAEDVGLSHAMERVLEHRIRLVSQGPIESLNVSVASALAMENVWGQ